jgi:uncharacterized protein
MKKNCNNCKALCCHYVALEIDEPDTKEDWDHIFWYLHHEKVVVFIDNDGDWMIEFKTKCKNLSPENKCLIYDHRPKICRAHGAEECEFHNEETPYEIQFNCVEDLKKYLKEKNIDYQFKEFNK